MAHSRYGSYCFKGERLALVQQWCMEISLKREFWVRWKRERERERESCRSIQGKTLKSSGRFQPNKVEEMQAMQKLSLPAQDGYKKKA